MNDSHVTVFAETTFRNHHRKFGIRHADRRYHLALIGKTGMGKSTLMETLMAADARAGAGFALLDPHGDLAERVRQSIPAGRHDQVVYFNPAVDHTLGFNVLENPGVDPGLIVSGVISVFKKIWAPDNWGPRMEHIFRYALWTLMPTPGTTLADVRRVLVDRTFRREMLHRVADETVKDFWAQEFERYSPNFREEAIAPILNKLGQFLSNVHLRSVLCQPQSAFTVRQIMDEQRIFIANASKGLLGEDGSKLLSALLLTHFELAALSRANVAEADRPDFHLYLDEFPTMVTSRFATVLSECRKYKLTLTLALQFVDQLEESLRAAVFENVGTLIAFRVGPESARFLEREFLPAFTETDLVELPRYHIYLRLMIDGVPSRPFSARTLAPPSS